ncbi:MAG: hypothetical protein ACO2O5_01375 [Candidatus Caldipriscus sp.]
MVVLFLAWPKVWSEYRDQFASDVRVLPSGIVGSGNVWNDTLFFVRFSQWSKGGSLIWDMTLRRNSDTWVYSLSNYNDTIFAVGFISDTNLVDRAILWKISPNGNILDTFVLDTPFSYFRDVYIDSTGNIFVAGYFWDNRYKAVFYKLDRNLNILWYFVDSTNIHNYGMSIAVSPDGSIYMVKEGWENTSPNWRWYLIKYSSWNVQISPSSSENQGFKVEVLPSSNVVSVGHFWNSHYNWWITKYDYLGNYRWGVQYGLIGVSDMAKDIRYRNGYIYTAGWFDDAPYTWRLRWEKRDTNGNLVCDFRLRWTNYDPRFGQGIGIDVDEGDTVYVAGYYLRNATLSWYAVFMKFYGCTQVGIMEMENTKREFYVRDRVFKDYTYIYNFGDFVDVFDTRGKFVKRYYNSKIGSDLKPGVYILRTSTNEIISVIKRR